MELPSRFYDVVVVGAGPAGSYSASELTGLGHSVAVVEQKSAPGLNVCCTGIISTECFDSFGISPDVILSGVSSVKFFSPSGRCLRLQSEKVQAYVLDRLLFDQAIASNAHSQGVQYLFDSQVIDIAQREDSVEVVVLCQGSREILTARAVIIANGLKSRFPQKLGLGKIKSFLIGAQAEVEAKDIDEVEVYFSQQIAPGSFAWLVPTSGNKALAGLLSPSHAKSYLEKFLLSPFCQGRVTSKEVKIMQKAIPMRALPHTYGARIIVVGDAAGQVKPTTGGGIYFGHLGAKIAARVLNDALSHDDLSAARLSHYQKEWKVKIGKEISFGYHARQFYARLNDRNIERIFAILDSGGIAEELLHSSDFSFDWHRSLILAGLKSGLTYPLRKIRHKLYSQPGD